MSLAAILRVPVIVLGMAVAGTFAQPATEGPGPSVGARVPDFRLSDQSGAPRNLQSLMGPKGLMLVFFRSADW